MLQAAPSTKTVLAALVLAALAVPARAADEYQVISLPGTPLDPSGVASIVIGPGQDDTTQTVDLPFSFPWFGGTYDRISICTNGWAAFGSTTESVSNNPALPSAAAPNAVLAPLWDDLVTNSGSVRTYTNGAAPARTFVIDWNGVGSFDDESSGLRFQILLREGAGAVEFAYASGGTFGEMSYTQGVEDPTGTVAFAPVGTGNDLSSRPSGIVRFEPRRVVVTGRLLRDRPVADATGLGNSTATGLAVEGATLRLVIEGTGDVAGTARTVADGSFAVTGFGIADTAQLALDVRTEGAAGRVVDTSGDVYTYRFASGLDADPLVAVGNVTLDDSVDAVHTTIRRALNVQQAVERGFRVADAAAAWGADNVGDDPKDVIPPLDVTWEPGVAGEFGSRYSPPEAGGGQASLAVDEGQANPDAWDDDVILREYGQHVLSALSVHPGPLPSPRDFAASTSPAFAWADGFGYVFAAAVQERDVLYDTIDGDTAVVDDLEAPPASARGDGFPAAVAGSLWDLVDPANEVEDELEGTLGAAPSTFVDVLATVDRLLDTVPEGAAELTVRDFFDVWRRGGTPEENADRVRTARIFIHHATLPDDDDEPNDRTDEATPTAGAGTKVAELRLSPENADVFRVVVPDGPPLNLVLTLQQSTSVDLRLELLDAGGAPIDGVSNEGLDDPERQTLRLQPVVPLPPGTYHARVSSLDDATGQYDLSFFRPLVIAVGDLPVWTVGVPFKSDFVASGGVEPYTFTSVTDAPGLAITENGTRLAGTPVTEGTYGVDVSVTDSAAPQTTVAVTRPFVVNPPPTLPPLLGIAEDRADVRVVGTGGTDTVWTPLTQPTNGLVLEGGPDLRLVGDSGSPTSFTVSADAQDSVGAALSAAESLVVVTGDLLSADGSSVPQDDVFGWFLDALAGSELDLTLRFRGSGQTPLLVNVVDGRGVTLPTAGGRIDTFGRKLKLRDVITAQTGRAHLLFQRNGFQGTVLVKPKVRPPRRFVGQRGIVDGGEVVEVPIDVLAGSRVRVLLRRQPSPTSLEPTVTEIEQPDGRLLSLPGERRRGRKRAILGFTPQQDGRHVVRITGRSFTTGPLFYKVRVRTPRGVRLTLD